jgi:hypothetical protein
MVVSASRESGSECGKRPRNEEAKEARMKVVAVCVMLVAVGFMLTGCASPLPMGGIYTEVKMPVGTGDSAVKATKVGVSQCTSILGMLATGDASIDAAKKQGGITKVSHVDWSAKNILGIIGNYTTTVYGE